MSSYIRPAAAFKKLDAAKLLKQNVYIYGATGFGKTELIRQYIGMGDTDNAKALLYSFEKTAKQEGLRRLYTSIEAMKCRIALIEGDMRTADEWMNTAPDENEHLYLKTTTKSVPELQPMDIRILTCLADGLSVQKTADTLNINYETLRSRIKEIYRKLGAKNKTEAVMIAREMKLI
ncbi:MAG: helix-turn-helix transcriptional regulator [Oscillospiraceae bacterium]